MKEIITLLEAKEISEERKILLHKIASVISTEIEKNTSAYVALNYICTHNSRRSQFSQFWSTVLCEHYGLSNIISYSGGTEATAVFAEVIESLKRLGFKAEKENETQNPVYSITGNRVKSAVQLWSKTFDDASSSHPYIALMTCSDADQNCPFIPGCIERIPFTFIDPKVSDGTDKMQNTYDERSLQIGSEINYIIQNIIKK